MATKKTFSIALGRRREWAELFNWGNEVGRQTGITRQEQINERIVEYKREKQPKKD